MNPGVADRFLDVFARYIDSGFGLVGGEVAFLASTLVAIDILIGTVLLDHEHPRAQFEQRVEVARAQRGVMQGVPGNGHGGSGLGRSRSGDCSAAGLPGHLH